MVYGTEYPLEKILGKEVGKLMKDEHEANGVKLHPGAKAVAINSNADGHVTSVKLSDGSIVECDLVVLGTGVRPATDFLKGTGIELA